MLVSTVVACSAPDLGQLVPQPPASDGPIVNQATIYQHSAAFVKGPGGKGNDSYSGPCVLPDSLVFDVGPKGATLASDGNSLVFPKNAVSQTVHIVMIPKLDSTASVQFYPEGLQFNPNALPTLTISTACIGNPANPMIVYTDDSGHVLEKKKSNKGKDGASVTADIAHFSRYAVAW